ncbi:sensor histidine kinase [Nonomuraea sediminis]|uniref:sensor histidine kinase n=1 Tax=Nonomuraea sediminis TaxID=2835864 RepID=UPI001BDCDA40|nr:HAMP domain-containing sensor histidine kinase [Nonomuraea sediminis]
MRHTLRWRLVAGVLALLAAACLAVGVASSLFTQHLLVARVDAQLVSAGVRFATSLEHEEPGELGDTRGQIPGTFGARLLNGRVTKAGVVTGNAGLGSTLSAADQALLASLRADGNPRSIELSSLDEYRVRAMPGKDGDVLITGLPLEEVERTLRRLQLVELALFGGALLVTGVAGFFWVRLALRPLDRVAATARSVSELPLASGEVTLAERVPDADPRSEIGQVAAAFNRMLGHVEDALAQRHRGEQRLRSFAADASHELRSPLAAILGHAQLALRRDDLSADVRHALGRIRSESGRMTELVEDLLLLARLDAGRPLAREEVDLTRLAVEAAGDAQVAGPSHVWRLDLPESPVTVCGDPGRLRQVVVNLLANARVHTPPGTTVTLAVARADGRAEVRVTDTGPGIAPDVDVFERFSRTDRGRSRASGGTGLGLAIVRAVVSAHQGTVDVDSRPGHTCFRVRLPA